MLANDIDSRAPWNINKFDASSNADAIATKAADTTQQWAVGSVGWSYDGAPTAGRLTISIGSTVFVDYDITSSGPGLLRFDHPVLMKGSTVKNEAVTVKLFAAGSGVTGKVWAGGW